MKRLLFVCISLCLALTCAYAGTFVNGSFETGDWTGWNQGGGYWGCCGAPGTWPIDPTNYLSGGLYYDMTGNRSAIVTPGGDPLTGGLLNQVYSGNYAARVNDSSPNYHVSVISQTVSGWSDPNIFFAWAAVLEASHTATDSDNFILKLTNDSKNLTLYEVAYNSANAPAGLFNQTGNWFWTPWQVQNLDVSQYIGDTFTLTLLGSDCPYGGHGGYVYLDGFGAIAPPPGGDPVPEPASFALLGLGLVGLALYRRKH